VLFRISQFASSGLGWLIAAKLESNRAQRRITMSLDSPDEPAKITASALPVVSCSRSKTRWLLLANQTAPRPLLITARPFPYDAKRIGRAAVPDAGGEVQLTDAINLLAQQQQVYAYVFDHGRFDVGNKLDYLKATVETAIERDDVGAEFRRYLADLVQRKKLV